MWQDPFVAAGAKLKFLDVWHTAKRTTLNAPEKSSNEQDSERDKYWFWSPVVFLWIICFGHWFLARLGLNMKSVSEGPRLVKHWTEVAIYGIGWMKRETRNGNTGLQRTESYGTTGTSFQLNNYAQWLVTQDSALTGVLEVRLYIVQELSEG